MSNYNEHDNQREKKEINKNEKSKLIIVGKNENHLFYINYKTKINNNDVYIKHIKAIIKVIAGFSKK